MMLGNALRDLFIEDFVDGDFNDDSFMVEVHQNYITVDRKHQHTSLIESKTIEVNKDVIVCLHKKEEDIFDLECKWLWRNPTYFENLSRKQAEDLQKIILQLSNALKTISSLNVDLKGIRVGNQIWSSKNIDLDLGLDSKIPTNDETLLDSHARLYTYHGVELINDLFKDWRVPTVEDYNILINFFEVLCWEELTQRMEFMLSGFYSSKIPEKEFKMFLMMNRALRSEYGGFYWTSDIQDVVHKEKDSGKRKYIYFNKYSQKITVEESSNAIDNMFSLRLIRK